MAGLTQHNDRVRARIAGLRAAMRRREPAVEAAFVALARIGTPVRRVSALSLPMLLRVMNYSEQGLDELPATAAAGARNGVIHDDA